MNKFIAVVSCCLVIGMIMQLSDAHDYEIEEDSCNLSGGRCSLRCNNGFDMNTEDTKLCSGGNTCCNKFENRCKSHGGQCDLKCPGKMPKIDTPDCKALGRECCVYL